MIALNEKLESLCKGVDGMFFWRQASLEQYLGCFPSGWGIIFSDIGNYSFFQEYSGGNYAGR